MHSYANFNNHSSGAENNNPPPPHLSTDIIPPVTTLVKSFLPIDPSLMFPREGLTPYLS